MRKTLARRGGRRGRGLGCGARTEVSTGPAREPRAGSAGGRAAGRTGRPRRPARDCGAIAQAARRRRPQPRRPRARAPRQPEGTPGVAYTRCVSLPRVASFTRLRPRGGSLIVGRSGRARRCRYPAGRQLHSRGCGGRRPPRTGTLDWYVPRLILEFLMQFLASCVAGTPSGRPARPAAVASAIGPRGRAWSGPCLQGARAGPAPQPHRGAAHAAVRPKVPSGLRATAAPFLICFFRSSRASAVLQLSRYTVNRSFPTTPNAATRAIFGITGTAASPSPARFWNTTATWLIDLARSCAAAA